MRPIGSTKDRQPIYKEEFDKLIELTKHDKDIQKDTKLKLIRAFTLLYLTGCRVCEILDFTLDDIEVICRNKIESLNNKNKMNRPRALRFSEEGVRMLSKLDYSDCPETTGYLFYKNASDKHMSEGVFTRMLNTYLAQKLSDLYTTHSFRAGIITRITEVTGNPEIARKFVGHSSIKTTLRYLCATPKQMDDAIDKLFKAEEK